MIVRGLFVLKPFSPTPRDAVISLTVFMICIIFAVLGDMGPYATVLVPLGLHVLLGSTRNLTNLEHKRLRGFKEGSKAPEKWMK